MNITNGFSSIINEKKKFYKYESIEMLKCRGNSLKGLLCNQIITFTCFLFIFRFGWIYCVYNVHTTQLALRYYCTHIIALKANKRMKLLGIGWAQKSEKSDANETIQVQGCIRFEMIIGFSWFHLSTCTEFLRHIDYDDNTNQRRH